ncbi:type II secretion system protein J [Roseibium alexandrii]
MIPRRSAKSGFSLTELLVSLAIFGLISLAATSVLSLGKQIWSKAQAIPDQTLFDAEVAALRKVIAGKVTSASAKGGGVSGTATGLSFEGLSRLENGSYEISTIVVDFSAAEARISASGQSTARTTMLRHLNADGLSYFGRKDGERQDGWSAAWSSSDPAPKLIQLKLETAKGPATLTFGLPR